jgi:RND family efflux transporter MFP subunit
MPILRVLVAGAAAGMMVAVAGGCGSGDETPPGRRPGGAGRVAFPVEVTTLQPRRLDYEMRAVGSLEAFESVQVTARVEGVVERVLFAEGDRLQRGQVMAEVDPERYRLALEAARAALERALAGSAEAEAALARREGADETTPGVVSREEIEVARTRVLSQRAAAREAEVAVERRALDLRDAYVRSPLDGVADTRSVQTGRFVEVGDVLATLVRRDPLLLRFQVPESEASVVQVGMAVGVAVKGVSRELGAVVTHVAQQADAASRMVSVVAEVAAADREAARPGAFAEVRVPTGEREEALTAPPTAIRPTERGFVAFVVLDGRAVERILQLGLRTPAGDVEVVSGLTTGDVLVVRGAEALRDGAPVSLVASSTGATTGTGDAAAP